MNIFSFSHSSHMGLPNKYFPITRPHMYTLAHWSDLSLSLIHFLSVGTKDAIKQHKIKPQDEINWWWLMWVCVTVKRVCDCLCVQYKISMFPSTFITFILPSSFLLDCFGLACLECQLLSLLFIYLFPFLSFLHNCVCVCVCHMWEK